MSSIDPIALEQELAHAFAAKQVVETPLSRDASFDVTAAYGVQAEHVRRRRAAGRTTVGRKIGYINRAMWPALGLDTLVWADMYDDTVKRADQNTASWSVASMRSPKIEPEIVFKLASPLGAGVEDAAAVLEHVEWLALGYEIIDCVYADWKYKPADFIAAFGLHVGLVVGEPRRIERADIAALAGQLPQFTIALTKNGQPAAQGGGRNILGSPALSLGELGSAATRQPGVDPLSAGEIITTGSLTDAQVVTAGETWTATLDGLALPPLTLRLSS